MNCANHPEEPATAFCRDCGKPLCVACQRPAQGTIFCEEHQQILQAAAASQYAATYPPPPGASPYSYGPNPYAQANSVSPGLAFLLGLIPGVGAIYNGQYAKGLIHAVILGLLISIMSSGAAGGMEPLIGMVTGLWFFYMAFEAYHTAAKRQRGEAVDEFSSIFPLNRGNAGRGSDLYRNHFFAEYSGGRPSPRDPAVLAVVPDCARRVHAVPPGDGQIVGGKFATGGCP
jgi:hypothetical protein